VISESKKAISVSLAGMAFFIMMQNFNFARIIISLTQNIQPGCIDNHREDYLFSKKQAGRKKKQLHCS